MLCRSVRYRWRAARSTPASRFVAICGLVASVFTQVRLAVLAGASLPSIREDFSEFILALATTLRPILLFGKCVCKIVYQSQCSF